MRKHIHKIKSHIFAHKIISAVVLIAIFGGGYWGYRKFTSTAGEARYLTGKVEKGDIIASVSGSGQVSASMQIDIKAKTSGDVIYVGQASAQKVTTGTLIAQLNTKDAQKSVRDAEINLESAQIALDKLKVQKSSQSLNADLAKAYDDGFNTVSNAYLDLPGIMTGLNDMFFKSSVGSYQRNVDWYEGQVISGEPDKVKLYKQNFLDSYDTATKAYNTSSDNYKVTSRTADVTTIEKLILQTYDTTKLISDVIKNANNYIDFVNDSLQKRNAETPVMINTQKANLSGYTSKTNTHLLNLLSIKTSIKSYKDAFLSGDLDIQSATLTVKQRENSLQDAKDNLADYFIRAPYAGTIAAINVKKSDSVTSGTLVATMVTDKQNAEISFNEVDVAKIKIGQKAILTFDAIADLTITGVVTEMDSIGTVEQGVVTYNVKISFDRQDVRVKPSMSVSATIIIDSKQGVLVVPNSAIKSLPARQAGQTGRSYVEMFDPPLARSNDGLIGSVSNLLPNKIQVVIGLSNDTNSEIISGLKEGDEIVTRTIAPTAASASSSAPSIFGSSTPANRGGAVGGTRVRAR